MGETKTHERHREMCQGCGTLSWHKSDTRVAQEWHKGVTRVTQEWHKGDTRVTQGWHREICKGCRTVTQE